MNSELAERLLAKVMDWSPEDIARERPIIQALSRYKYDDYQQFSPGMRYVESLALWLNQFDSDERISAYQFIKPQLIFISNAEMAHLVSITYNDYIRPILVHSVSEELSISELYPLEIVRSKEFEILLRQSLFLGLSDGAHIDIFRRSNPNFSNEQVLQTYVISLNKAREMSIELKKDLENRLNRPLKDEEAKFRMIFLLDDFSGSGISYFRKDEHKNEYGGKIKKILSRITGKDCEDYNKLEFLFNLDNLKIHVLLSVSTEQAVRRLNETIKQWLRENGLDIKITVTAVQEIPEIFKIDPKLNDAIVNLLSKYFDKNIIDEHYRKGKHEIPFLGFDECALPLILSHNTPNNSLPLLWFDPRLNCRGLFPRVSRHKEG